jgi:hypothetical protein
MDGIANHGFLDEAEAAWRALEEHAFGRRWFRFAVFEAPGSRARASLWTLVHVLAAANDLAALGRDPDLSRLLGLLPRYRADRGYLPTPGARLRFFDDNAWLGLLSLRLADRTGDPSHRRRARRIAAFLAQGEHPGGGIRWREAHESRNTASTAPTAELLLALGGDDRVRHAERLARWLHAKLVRPDGLAADRIEDGIVEPTPWSYGQGVVVGMRRLLAAATGDAAYRVAAIALARESLGVFTASRTWTEPPPFLAIWFRELLALPEVADAARARLLEHTTRLLAEGRDPSTGMFTAGGVGSYDGRPTIDQAAAVQLLALAAGAPPAPAGDV